MNRAEAEQEMILLLGADVFGQLTHAETGWALGKSRSGDDWDPWMAAAAAADLLGGRARAGRVTKFTADGATFEKSQDWHGWAGWLRSQSPRNAGDSWGSDFAFLVV